MNTAHLVTQLMELERAIGSAEPTRLRGMIFEAQETLLGLQQQMIEILIENETLRQQMEFGDRFASVSDLPEPRVNAKYSVN